MRGRKPNLNNVLQFPSGDEPTTRHIDLAAALRPDDMEPGALEIWDWIAPYMVMMGRLKPYYVLSFAEYCYLVDRIATTRKLLKDIGETYETITRNGLQHKSRPQLAQLNDDFRKLQTMTARFGLTPSDEKSLLNSIDNGDLINEFSEFK